MPEKPHSKRITRVTHTETVIHTVADSSETTTSSPERRKLPRKEVLQEIAFAVCLCVFMAALATLFNDSSVGREFSSFVYRVLQGRLTDSEGPKRVTLIDIGNLPPDPKSGVTSRNTLQNVLKAVAEQDPAVIGIDIDFSPEAGKFVDPCDPRFFAFCQSLRKPDSRIPQNRSRIPVFLGIYRSRALPPTRWLGFPAYQDLAAALLVSTTSGPSIWSLSDAASASDSEEARFPKAPTMSAALAAKVGLAEPKVLQSLFERFFREKVADIVFQAFYIDYSAGKHLAENAIVINNRDYSESAISAIMRSRSRDLAGNIVLIGDVSNAAEGDLFRGPSGDALVPGVVVHASAANTLVKSPLYAFPEIKEFWLDLIFSLSILGLVILVRLVSFGKLNENRIIVLANYAVATSVLLFGLAVNYTRVLWPDFLLLSIGLLLHPAAHRRVKILEDWFLGLKDWFLRWMRQPSVKSR